ncbi:hypothetical protein KQI42_09830 [Tissierella sp. MSJ-40]|uniref:Uncharacterized protein n=1 Tax=Tissierella simiarum TaxID=2841534 RepID=A0ABS6E7T3_9FIRM|nr:hypothetical protein [Tissierella simiarum]MBU5438309.1 hypothetical protein [Tissierella simiarum]
MHKKGDRVKVRSDLKADTRYDGIYCHAGMLKHSGKKATIVCTQEHRGRADVFYIDIDTEGYYWSSSMFE